MKGSLKRLYVNKSVEEIIFSLILIVGIPYFLTNEIIDLSTNRSWIVGIINFSLIFSIGYLLRRSIKGTLKKTHIFTFSLLLAVGFALFWPSSTGLSGAGAYVFQSLIVVLILVNTGKSRIFFVFFLILMVFIAGFADLDYKGNIVYVSQLVSFVLNTIIIALVMNLFKIALDWERKKLLLRIKKLNQTNEEIQGQNRSLQKNHEEIKRIQTHLQQIIKDRTQEIEKENERMIEYAFINAHLVRAPLANMLGINELMETKHPKFKKLSRKMEAMDQTVRKIGGILSVEDSGEKRSSLQNSFDPK